MPSPSLDAWHSSLGGRVHLSPCVSLHLSPVVSPPGCLARLSGWTRSFVSLGSLFSLCLPSFVSRCRPAWMIQSGWTGSFVSLCHLSPVVSQPGCLARLSGWTGSFVSLCLPSFVSQPGCLARLGFICLLCLPSFVSRCLPAWMPGWTDSLVSLCLPSFVARCLPAWIWHGSLRERVHVSPFVPFICLPFSLSLDDLSPFVSLDFSRCLPAWMPGTALWVDGFICLPLSPFICLPLSPSLDAWRGSLGGRVHLSTFVSQHLCFPSFVSRCLPAWMPGTVFLPLSPFIWLLCLPAWMSVTALQADGFTCLPWFPFICLPSLWVDGFICFPLSPFVCLPLSPSLDAWHGSLGGRIHLSPVVSQPGCVALTLRGFLHFPRFCPFGGVWFAFGFGPGFGHSLSCGCWGQGPPLSALYLDFDFAWARGGSSSLSIVGYTLSVRSVPRYQLRSRADDSGALRCAASATRRLC